MPQPRPLPRSLVPIPGESLPGFLLRLSCRLNMPPARLARLTGLAPAGHSGASLPVTLLAGIPEPASRTFTFTTRLDDWHLPVVFACPAHQRLLEHICPGCGQVVRGHRPGAQFSLLPATPVAGL